MTEKIRQIIIPEKGASPFAIPGRSLVVANGGVAHCFQCKRAKMVMQLVCGCFHCQDCHMKLQSIFMMEERVGSRKQKMLWVNRHKCDKASNTWAPYHPDTMDLSLERKSPW